MPEFVYPRHRTRHTNGQSAQGGHTGNDRVPVVEIHFFEGRRRGRFTEIERANLTGGAIANHGETAPANIAGLGMNHRQGQRHRRRRIEGVAALLEHRFTHIRSLRRRRGHDTVVIVVTYFHAATAKPHRGNHSNQHRHERVAAQRFSGIHKCPVV